MLSPDICSRPGFPRFSLIKAGSKARELCLPPVLLPVPGSLSVCLSVPSPLLTSAVVASHPFLSSFLNVQSQGAVTTTALLRKGAWAELTLLGNEAKVEKFVMEQRASDKARRTN